MYASVTISRVLYWTVIYPGRASPRGSSDRGGRGGPPSCLHCILHRVGFTSPACYQAAGELLPRLSILTVPKGGGFFLLARRRRFLSVALSLESPPPAVSRHPCPVVPGLSSCPKACDRLFTSHPDSISAERCFVNVQTGEKSVDTGFSQ